MQIAPPRIRDAIAQLVFAAKMEGWIVERQHGTKITGQEHGYLTHALTGETTITIRPPSR
jgi:hypothetical protein